MPSRDPSAPARYGLPVKTLREGGMHVAVEVIPKRGEYLYAVTDKGDSDLAFPTDFLAFGEEFDTAVRRVLKAQLQCTVERFYLATAKSHVDGSAHWALTLVFVADIGEPKPVKGKKLEKFTLSTVPPGLVGWNHLPLRDALER